MKETHRIFYNNISFKKLKVLPNFAIAILIVTFAINILTFIFFFLPNLNSYFRNIYLLFSDNK